MTVSTPPAFRGAGAVALCALLCGSLSGCGGVRGNQPQSTQPLVLQIGTSLPRRGIPGGGVPAVLTTLTSEPLISADRNGRVQARVAEHWDWIEDGRVLKMTLPEGVHFHDGTTLDAASVVDLLKREIRQNPTFTYNSITAIDAPDARTILIRLARREAFLPEDLALVSLRHEAVGTGAFVIDSAAGSPTGKQPIDAATLKPFAGYRQGAPQIARVDVKAYPTLRSAWTAMMRGEINMLYEVSNETEDFVENQTSSVRTYSFLRPYVLHMTFNMRHPILQRRDVRQALSEAIDRQAIVKDAMRGRGEPADGPVWKYHWANSNAQRTYAYNPPAARLRLDAAGLVPRAASPGAMPKRLGFTCLLWGGDSRFERIALVVQKQLYDIGVDVKFEPVSTEALLKRIQSGDYDALLFEILSGPSLNFVYRNWHGGGVFASGYNAADEALERLRGAIDELDVRDAVGAVQRIFYDDPPAVFLAWPQASRAVNADIDVSYQPNGDIVGRIWKFKRASQQEASR
jgi:peptide/nickel transport system substrate-binding protein